MKKYMTPTRFSAFYIEHKGREGSLLISPKRVMCLSAEDVLEIRKFSPKIAAQLKELPEPKRPKWAEDAIAPRRLDLYLEEEPELCEGCEEGCTDCDEE